MPEITYKQPEIEIQIENKPQAFANQSYPYNHISNDRRFEELIYSIVKLHLGKGLFTDYDSVSLMSGVREKGRDCALFYQGKSDGVIQCKKYEKNLSKEEFGKEITKFILYSILEKKILHDPKNFTYYIAVSKGFVLECSDFIDSFNSEILIENKLESWVNYNINKYSSLQHLELHHDLIRKVRNILSQIKVQKIIPPDLDFYLNSSESSKLSTLFFEVRTVIDTTAFVDFKEQIIDVITEPSKNLPIKKILDRGSLSLKSERNEFSEIPDSHIERQETISLFQWVNADLRKNELNKPLNICLLAGNAGMGKTVILKDLYELLSANNIAVLGLKADKLASSNIIELQNKIGLTIPLYDFIEECKLKYTTTIILIDQIDALSQSMSSDRSYLEVFKNIIENYLYDENIRIIISVRIFDLHYDPSLQLYKNTHTITVKPLTESQVILQLAKLGIHKNTISNKLLDLLTIPNHLNVFSRIYKVHRISSGIHTLQDMYHELWRQKVLGLATTSVADKKLTRELLYKIADNMFSNQQISISESKFEDYSKELSYIESERLIKREDKQIQFFHQSFYDFIFAKNFVESGKDFNTYVKDNGQSLLIRSAVKMMLNYLRDYDTSSYLQTLKSLFNDEKILFHIKHLVLSSILFVEKPTQREAEIVLKIISESFHLCTLFFEKANSEYWFVFATNNNLLEILNTDHINITSTENIDSREFASLKNAALNFLRSASIMDFDKAWQRVQNLRDISNKMTILRVITNWNIPIKYSVFESCKNFRQENPYFYFRILNNIAKINPDYAILQLSYIADSSMKQKVSDNGEYTVLSTLSKICPDKIFPLLLTTLINDVDNISEREYLSGASKYMRVHLEDKDRYHGSDDLFRLLASSLRESAKRRDQAFLLFFEVHKFSRIQPVLRLLNFSLLTNEEIYPNEIFEFIQYVLTLDELHHDSNIASENRKLFEKTFPLFSRQQQVIICQQIKDITHVHEILTYKTHNGKVKIHSFWGLTKYCWLKRVPITIINGNRELKKLFSELARRFPNYVEKENNGHVIAGVVNAPLPSKAYEIMSAKQWILSFKKYNGTLGHFERPFLKGDLEQHSQTFKTCVQNDPSLSKLKIIETALDDKEIDIRYPIYGIWGWSESNANTADIIPLFITVLSSLKSDYLKYICLIIAENLTKENTVNDSIIEYLVNSSLNFEGEKVQIDNEESIHTETSIEHLVSQGLNSNSGSAASTLIKINDEKHFEVIINAVEIILSTAPAYIRAATLYQFAYLMNINPTKTFEVFINAVSNEENIHVVASSIWSLQYMGNYSFEKLIPVYKKLVSYEFLGKDDSEWLFLILYNSYMNSKTDAENLVYQLIKNNRYACSSAINIVLHNYYLYNNYKDKNNPLLELILENITQEDFDNYGINFNNSLNLRLSDIYTFIKKYIQSPYFRV